MCCGERDKIFLLFVVFLSSFPQHSSPDEDNTEPVDDLHEGNEAEAQEQTKHSPKRGDEVYDGHPLASLIFFKTKLLRIWEKH